jgi:hypothetical protein
LEILINNLLINPKEDPWIEKKKYQIFKTTWVSSGRIGRNVKFHT